MLLLLCLIQYCIVLLKNARAKFRKLLTESTQKLECLSKNLGKCIERAKPYYDARVKANEVRDQFYAFLPAWRQS